MSHLIYDDTDPVIDVYYDKVKIRAEEMKRYIDTYKNACKEMGIKEPWLYKAQLIRAFPQYQRMFEAILAQMREDGVIDFDDHKPSPIKIYCRSKDRVKTRQVAYGKEPILPTNTPKPDHFGRSILA